MEVLAQRMHPTCQRVLSQKNPDYSDICGARPLGPPDAIDTGTIDESLEDELATLVLRSCSEDSNGEGGRSKRMPPHRDIIQVLENVYTEGIYRAYIIFSRGLKGKNKG